MGLAQQQVTEPELECSTCCRPFYPDYQMVKQELLIVCPHCGAHYVPHLALVRDDANY